jgi:hypothetical protein
MLLGDQLPLFVAKIVPSHPILQLINSNRSVPVVPMEVAMVATTETIMVVTEEMGEISNLLPG